MAIDTPPFLSSLSSLQSFVPVEVLARGSYEDMQGLLIFSSLFLLAPIYSFKNGGLTTSDVMLGI